MDKLIEQFVHAPECDETNYQLALAYESQGQTASAVSFYLRAAERSTDSNLSYECFLRIGLIFEKQDRRYMSSRGMYQQAIAICPKRPEGYFLLSRRLERDGTRTNGQDQSVEFWFSSYNYACIGLEAADHSLPNLLSNVEYPGKFGLEFEKAVAGWWCGFGPQSQEIFQKLLKNNSLPQTYLDACKNNLERLSK